MTTATDSSDTLLHERIRQLEKELQERKNEVETAQSETARAEGLQSEAEREFSSLKRAYEDLNQRFESWRASLTRHVWRNDVPDRATYCVHCGHSWPLHKCDCPFIEVE